MAATDELRIIITTKTQGQGAQQAEQGVNKLEKALKVAATAFAALKSAQVAVDFVKFGADVQRQSTALDNLAASAGTSGAAITDAIRGASDFTIDRMTAMETANRALIMGVAKTPEQFEKLTKVAVALGRAMDQDATKSIDDFITAGARQSTMIADNLGLTVKVEQATANYAAQLGKTADELTDTEKSQAFLNEMLVQGEAKMAALGDTSGGLATDLEKISAAIADAKTGFAEMAASMLAGAGGVDDFTGRVRNLPNALKQTLAWLTAVNDAQITFVRTLSRKEALEEFGNSLKRQAATMVDFGTASEQVRYAYTRHVEAIEKVTYAAESMTPVMAANIKDFATYEKVIASNTEYEENLAKVKAKLIERQEEAARSTRAEAAARVQAQYSLARSFSSSLGNMESASDDFYDGLRDEEARHQKEIETLRQRGASRSIQIDAQAEQEKLTKLQRSLDIALTEQAGYTDKTAQATQMRKADQIAALQGQIAEQTQLLDDYHAGRLVQTGENVTGLIAEEERLHAAKKLALEEEMAAAKEARRQEIEGRVAEAAVGELDKALSADQITLDQYRTAVGEVQLAFGLTDQASLNMSNSVLRLVENMASGQLAAEDFNEALGAQVQIYDTELQQIDKFGTTLAQAYEPTANMTAEQYALNEQGILYNETLDNAIPRTNDQAEAMEGLSGVANTAWLKVGSVKSALDSLPREKKIDIYVNYHTRGNPPITQSAGGTSPVTGVGTPPLGLSTFSAPLSRAPVAQAAPTLNIYVSNPDPGAVVREIEQYMRLKGHMRWAGLGH